MGVTLPEALPAFNNSLVLCDELNGALEREYQFIAFGA